MGQFKYAKAVDLFQRLSDDDPASADKRVDLAIGVLNRQLPNDQARALEILDTVLKDNPSHLRALYCSALLKFLLGNFEQSQKQFAEVARADPKDAHAVFYVAECLLKQGKFDQAVVHFRNAVAIDPYLRSGYYGIFRALLRLGQADSEEAESALEDFKRLEDNPKSHLIEIKYTRMGRKAEVAMRGPSGARSIEALVMRKGKLFAEPTALKIEDHENLTDIWRDYAADASAAGEPSIGEPSIGEPSIVVLDVDGDGELDIFIAGGLAAGAPAQNAVLLKRNSNYKLDLDHPLSTVRHVNTALCGDYDNDGRTDVYLCRRGANQLWRQVETNQWQDVTAETKTAGGDLNTVDGMMVDADHDGDLDFVLVHSDGPNELLSNNLDGTFRPLGEEFGLAGNGRPSRSIVVADFDHDRDLDLLVIKKQPPHEIFINDRLWNYHPGKKYGKLQNATILAAVTADANVDGQTELYTWSGKEVFRWQPNEKGEWSSQLAFAAPKIEEETQGRLAVLDVDGDMRLDLILSSAGQGYVVPLDYESRVAGSSIGSLGPIWAVLVEQPDLGPGLLELPAGKPPRIGSAGPGRFSFATLAFSGQQKKEPQMRSNTSGIGVSGAVRIGSRWSAFHTLRSSSGPGQSLQPLAIGLAGAKTIDFVSMTWPDGVFQTELSLASGKRHTIMETERQLSSCPVLFVWNGSSYAFVTDLLGVGGIGFNLGRGEYAPPRPWENLLLPPSLLKPKDGRYHLKLAEPMEEVCYLDSVGLVAYDLPPGWKMAIDDRFAELGPQPTGEPLYYRREQLPIRAVNDRQQDVTSLVTTADLKPADPGHRDHRFIGLTEPSWLVLEFEEPLNEGPGQPALVIDGWIEYPYSQTTFAAWQAGVEYQSPSLEARDQDGKWQMVIERFGYPAGMPRQMALPIPRGALPAGTTALRLSTNVEVYWDRIAVVHVRPCAEAVRSELPLVKARLSETGFAHRTTGTSRLPHYDYDRRSPLWDTRHTAGWYTALGPMAELVAKTDDAVAIFGPGEEVHVEFRQNSAKPPAGWTRRFVLESAGWCKDMDLFTKDGETVGPLPTRQQGSAESDAERDRLHRRYNTRFRSGF